MNGIKQMRDNVFKDPNHKLDMNDRCCWLSGWGGFGVLAWFGFFEVLHA